jgi:hypothetical protein
MTTEDTSREDVSFSPDFAGRVLEEADRIAARRERVLRASVLAVAFAATGVVGVWSVWRVPKPVTPTIVAANTQTLSDAVAQSARTEPLDYMFPEATPLAEFADQYSGAATSATATRQDILFAGETTQDSE